MIGKISNNTMTLNASSEEMNAAAGQAGNAVGNINDDLHNMLTGAVEQTGNAQNIKNSIHNMNIHLEKTLGKWITFPMRQKRCLMPEMTWINR